MFMIWRDARIRCQAWLCFCFSHGLQACLVAHITKIAGTNDFIGIPCLHETLTCLSCCSVFSRSCMTKPLGSPSGWSSPKDVPPWDGWKCVPWHGQSAMWYSKRAAKGAVFQEIVAATSNPAADFIVLQVKQSQILMWMHMLDKQGSTYSCCNRCLGERSALAAGLLQLC